MGYRVIGTGELPTPCEPAKLGEVIMALRYMDGLIEAEEAKAQSGTAHTWIERTRQERAEWARIFDAARIGLLEILEPSPSVANLAAGIDYTQRRIKQATNALQNPHLTAHQRDAITKQIGVLNAELECWQAAYSAQIPPAPVKKRNRFAVGVNQPKAGRAV